MPVAACRVAVVAEIFSLPAPSPAVISVILPAVAVIFTRPAGLTIWPSATLLDAVSVTVPPPAV